MKKITLFFTALFIAINAFSVNITNGTKLYLKPNNNWKADGARFAAYFFGGDGELWVSMTDSNNDGIYEVTCQGARENVIFCRMNGGDQNNGWNTKWNQTNDLTWDGTKCQFNIPEGVWDGANNDCWVMFGDNSEVELPTTWTIAGTIPCLGAEWATDKTENDLIEGENGIWTKTYTNVEIAAGTYEYKITKYHMWSESYPAENAKLEIAETGKYNLTFTFNENSKEVNCLVEKAKENQTNIENITINNIFVQNGMIMADEEIAIFTITGQNVTDMNGNLTKGVYVVKSANATTKVVVK